MCIPFGRSRTLSGRVLGGWSYTLLTGATQANTDRVGATFLSAFVHCKIDTLTILPESPRDPFRSEQTRTSAVATLGELMMPIGVNTRFPLHG